MAKKSDRCRLYLYLDQEKYIEECFKGLFEQNRDALSSLEVVILDGLMTDKSKALSAQISERHGQMVRVVECPGMSDAQAYEANLSTEQADQIGFIKATTIYEAGSFAALRAALSSSDCSAASLEPYYFNRNGTEKLYIMFEEPRDQVIDLNDQVQYYQPYPGGYLFDAALVEGMHFDTTLKFEAVNDMLIRLLEKAGSYHLNKKRLIAREDLEVDGYNYPYLYDLDWYTPHVSGYITSFLQEHTSRIAQFAMLYSISIKFLGNQNDRNKALFTPDQKEEFYDAVRAALQFIDDDIIFYNGYFSMRRIMPRPMYFNFYVQKHGGKQPKVAFADTPIGRAATTEDGVIIEPVSAMHVEMHAINNEKDTLELWGFLRNFYFMDYDKIRVSVLAGSERTEGKRNEIYSLSHFFGDAVSKNYSFMVSVPKDQIKNSGSFCIECEYEGNTFRLPVCFEKPQSHLWEIFPNAYWRFDKHYLKYDGKACQFVVKKCNPLRGIKNELCYWHSMIKYGIKLERSLKCIPVRLLYFLSKPFFAGKEIWITYDQLFKGGDNGEYFYRYVSERKDKGRVRIYYIVNKNTREYKELQEKYGTVLAFNSLKNKLVSLHADYVFATRVAVNIYMGYWQQTERYFRDMFNSRVFCLQHGLTIQKIAQYQNRLFDNTRLYFCVSPAEIDNLRRPIYGYDEKELLLTGAPRYDGLVSKDKHFILISPTWRRNVTAGTNKKGSNHGYSPNFKHTEYFRIYNSLINDERLIEQARKTGYKLIYLIHPILSPQIKDFDTNDYVQILPGAGNVSYEKILSEASLMLTDHSGIQFDFAYMRKPLVYYHPDTLPPQYEEGGLKYETMGFGPVCRTHEQVVDALCDYMEKNCALPEEYAERIESFFAFNDHNNCQRIYEAAKAYTEKLNCT